MRENIKQALHLAGRGLRVFPLLPDMKRPAFAGWQAAATTDPAAIRTWYEGPYVDSGVGVATGQGVFVVDADGAQGRASLDVIEMSGADISLTVDTPSGGRHAYFTAPDGQWVPNSVKSLSAFPGIDIRGDGGFVAAPGSSYNGKPYILTSDGALATAPDWLVSAAIGGRKQRDKADANPLIELDTEPAIARAIEYLKDKAPGAVAFAFGNDTTYKVAARVKDFGISEEMNATLLAEHWNETKAEPPWDIEEIMAIVANAYAHGTSSPGAASALAEFDAVEIAEPANDNAPSTSGLFDITPIWDMKGIALGPRRPELIEGILDQNSLSVIFGQPGSKKTFFGMKQGFCIATGTPWDGHATEKAAVVHVLAEGSIFGAAARLDALLAESDEEKPPYFLIKSIVDLRSSDADVKKLARSIKACLAFHKVGVPLGLIIVDTLNQAFGGGNESASEDMGAFVLNCKKLMHMLDTSVQIIHHSGKEEAKGARGSTVLFGAIDTEIELICKLDEKYGTARNTKQRDKELFEPKRYTLTTVDVGIGANGKMVTTATLSFVSAAQAEFDGQMDVPPLLQDYLDILDALAREAPNRIVAGKDWDNEYADFLIERGRPVVQPRTLKRYRATLIESKRIVRVDQSNFTMPSPKEIEE